MALPLRVWAPNARVVEIEVDDQRTALRPGSDGWWSHPEGLSAGTDYAFVVDGSGPFPDPRSPHQPHGVHGPSRLFDTGAHGWRDQNWAGRDVRGAVIYELHVGTFTPGGTLDSAIERLDHLASIGIEMVQLMPLAAFPGERGWGYDGVALYAVHEAYGGPAALQRFVDAAHERGLAVALDVVYNHLGPSGNYLSQFGPYFTDVHHTPWGEAVNLDQPGSREVRAFIVENALRWLRDFHLDALRLDAVHELQDSSPVHVLAELSAAVADLAEQVGRPLSLIAESDLNDVTMVTPLPEGLGMTAQWDDDIHHALHAFLTGERHGYYDDFGSLATLAGAWRDVFVHNGSFSSFRGKVWGAPVPERVDRRRFVVSTSTHDQVGNRGLGDRPTASITPGQAAIGAALLLTSPFTPMFFMGEEWGARTPFQFFTDMDDPDLAIAIREGRQREFGEHGWDAIYGGDVESPDPQAVSTFAASRLDWAEQEKPIQARHLAWVRELLALRRRYPELSDGDASSLEITAHEAANTLVLRRGSIAVVVNASDTAQRVDVPGLGEDAEVLASWARLDREVSDAVDLAGHDVVIVAL